LGTIRLPLTTKCQWYWFVSGADPANKDVGDFSTNLVVMSHNGFAIANW